MDNLKSVELKILSLEKVLRDMVVMIEDGDEHGMGSTWYLEAKLVLDMSYDSKTLDDYKQGIIRDYIEATRPLS